MTLNGVPVLNYNVTETELTLCVNVSSMEDARNVISDDLMLKDGVGNDFMHLQGFSNIKSIAYLETLGAYEIRAYKKTTAEQKVAELEKVNQELREEIKKLTESNTMLEECIVEMAGIVYA